jgi:uridine kinase
MSRFDPFLLAGAMTRRAAMSSSTRAAQNLVTDPGWQYILADEFQPWCACKISREVRCLMAVGERCCVLQELICVTGPSGSGKSTAVAASGLPVFGLDAFYRSRTVPGLPRWFGDVDWESLAVFDVDLAMSTLQEVIACGSAEVYAHDLVSEQLSSVMTRFSRRGPCLVVEGTRADDVVASIVSTDIVIRKYVVRRNAGANFFSRVARDVRHRRRPLVRAVIRSLRVMLLEKNQIRSSVAAGAAPVTRVRLTEVLAAASLRCAEKQQVSLPSTISDLHR